MENGERRGRERRRRDGDCAEEGTFIFSVSMDSFHSLFCSETEVCHSESDLMKKLSRRTCSPGTS